MGIYSKGPKNEFQTAMVNEPSVFEPLKFHCTWLIVSVYMKWATKTPKNKAACLLFIVHSSWTLLRDFERPSYDNVVVNIS